VKTGFVLSVALNVWLHVLLQPAFVTVKFTVYVPQVDGATTETVELVAEPEIVAPVTDQL
jgi:hypothetical protein